MGKYVYEIESKGSIEGPPGTANAVPLFLTVRRCRTTILVDRTV